MSCTRSQGFLAKNQTPVRETVSAARKLGRADALELAAKATRIIVAKGKSVTAFDMRANPPSEDALLAAMLGPTGNLRAPAMLVGQTLLIGFSQDAYQRVLGV